MFQSHIDPTDRQVKGKIQEGFKGKKMAGHMGDKYRTMLNLEVIKSDLDNSLLYLKGSIPGSKTQQFFYGSPLKMLKEKH